MCFNIQNIVTKDFRMFHTSGKCFDKLKLYIYLSGVDNSVLNFKCSFNSAY